MVKGLPVIHEQSSSCEDCIIWKHQRDNFPTSTPQSKEHLEIVHTDLCVPMQTQSIGGRFYSLTFIDYFSRKIWVYFFKNKLETFSKFKEFKALNENQSGIFIKVLKSYGRGEYDSHEFRYFFMHHGIQRNFTTK